MSSWEEVRHGLLIDYRPNALDRMSGQASKAADNLWREITIVERAQAWRSTTALAGQLLELLLKQAVMNAGAAERIAKKPLGEVLREAERRGIFSPPTDALTVANSLYAAKELRNIASHGSPWQDDDTEQRATYSLIYLVCFAGYLFPRTDIAQQEQEPDAAITGSVLDGAGEIVTNDVPQPAFSSNDQLAMRVRSSSPRSILRLAHAEEVDKRSLVTVFTENFGYVIENTGYGRVRSLFDLAKWCQNMKLSAHAKSCGILLPHDADALDWLGRQSPHTFVTYLYECRRAEPRLFNGSFNKGGVSAVIKVARDWLNRADVSTVNVAYLLYNVPTGALARFLDEACDQIAEGLRYSTAPTGVAWLPLVARANRIRTRTRDAIAGALLDALAADDDQTVAATPVRLAQLGVIDDQVSAPVVDQLLHRVVNGMEIGQGQRVVWDLYAMSQTHALRAVDVAYAMFPKARATASPWVVLLWSSVILAAGGSVDTLDHDTISSLAWPPGREDLVQQLRVGFALAKLDMPLAPSRIRHLGELAHTFVVRRSTSYTNSVKFINECLQLFPLGPKV